MAALTSGYAFRRSLLAPHGRKWHQANRYAAQAWCKVAAEGAVRQASSRLRWPTRVVFESTGEVVAPPVGLDHFAGLGSPTAQS
jgi:hypothetical protein